MTSGLRAARHLRSSAKQVEWPKEPVAVVSADEKASDPDTVKLDTPVACRQDEIAYWSLGGPGKSRARVRNDPTKVLKLNSEYTVGVRFRVGESESADYDTLLMGNDNIFWLAVTGRERRLCCVNGKTGQFSTLEYPLPLNDWVIVFLQPRQSGTVIITADDDGPLEAGVFELSLVGSRLENMGWAPSEVHIAEVAVWTRCVEWSEMAATLFCGPNETELPPPVAKPHAIFRGQVTDIAGRRMPDVYVSWGKGGCATDEDGCFAASLSDDETDVPEDASTGSISSGSTIFSFSCEGFAPMSLPARSSRGGHEACMQVMLRPISTSKVFDAAKGGSLEDPSTGSSLSIPPDAFMYPDGTLAEGSVNVSLAVIDVTDPAALATMPGDFSAVGANGAEVHLQSLGAAWVGAADGKGKQLTVREDSGGVTLNLKSTATADASKLDEDAEMWAFNESTGKWELLQTPLKVNGEVAPNSAAKATASNTTSQPSVGTKFKGKKKMKKYDGEIDYIPEGARVIEGCMSPDAFRAAIKKDGEKTFSTNLTKLGYINCDLAYHHPQRAVMLTGCVFDNKREPMVGVQLWGVGKDYNGRTPDVTNAEGKFGAMIAQFDSKVDIEVHAQRPVDSDDKVEVYFDSFEWYEAAPVEQRKLLQNIPGKYLQKTPDVPAWIKKAKSDTDKEANIIWVMDRRQWHHFVGDMLVFIKDGSEADRNVPFDAGWRLASSAREKWPTALGSVMRPPLYKRPVFVEKQCFGPFTTGPPGEFVDVGEICIQ